MSAAGAEVRAPHRRHRVAILRVALALALGAAAALLVACGSSGKGLIPASQGGPLQSDIEAVDQAAESGDGNCKATEEALLKTDQDFASLSSSVDTGLRNNLRQGIDNLRQVALNVCSQPVTKTTTTTTSTKATPPPSTTKTTTTTESTPTETPPAEETPPSEEAESPPPGGGTPAPGEGQGKAPGEGSGGAGIEENPTGEAGK